MGVNPAANDDEALCRASARGQTEIVRMLLELPLERGVNPAIFSNFSLRRACCDGHTEIVCMLLDLNVE